MTDGPELLVTERLDDRRTAVVRSFIDAAFEGRFDDDDWAHALGGVHFLVEHPGGVPLAHASVIERTIRIGERRLRTGYLEAVATRPGHQGRGLGSRVVEAASAHVRSGFELGGLGTGRASFYERLGWEVWPGPTGVLMPDGRWRATPDDDGGILILRTPFTPPLDSTMAITCEWRPGDVW